MNLILTFLICLTFVATAQAQAERPPLPQAIEEVYLAKDDGSGKPGEQVTEFLVTDVPIHCVILLESSSATLLKMNFVAVTVAGVKPETKVVTASYTTKEGQNHVNFTGRPDEKWTPGKYRVDLFLNGQIVKNVEFEIKGGGALGAKYFRPPGTSKPKPLKRPVKTKH